MVKWVIDKPEDAPILTSDKNKPIQQRGKEKDGPKKLYWTQPIPVGETSETTPSKTKRAKLRAKRKKHGKR